MQASLVLALNILGASFYRDAFRVTFIPVIDSGESWAEEEIEEFSRALKSTTGYCVEMLKIVDLRVNLFGFGERIHIALDLTDKTKLAAQQQQSGSHSFAD